MLRYIQEDECVNVEGLLASISLECVAIYRIELVVLFKVILKIRGFQL